MIPWWSITAFLGFLGLLLLFLRALARVIRHGERQEHEDLKPLSESQISDDLRPHGAPLLISSHSKHVFWPHLDNHRPEDQ